ncbi:MAG: hypothetical protein LW832_00890 [Parachlamydia sp.]|jgi:hypothetical protein|nr:hypothetical protein [Parachlamydia sp.]
MSIDLYLDQLTLLNSPSPLQQPRKWCFHHHRLIYQLNPGFFQWRPFPLILKRMNQDLGSFLQQDARTQQPAKLNQLKSMLDVKVTRYREKNTSLLSRIKRALIEWFFGNVDEIKNDILQKIAALSSPTAALSCPAPLPSSAKQKALLAYIKDPIHIKKTQKSILFRDIRAIESNDSRLTSVEAYLRHFSKGKPIKLSKSLSSQFIVDCFKELNKESSIRLIEWLVNQPTFHAKLWAASLEVLLAKEKDCLPFDLYAVEKLLRHFISKYPAVPFAPFFTLAMEALTLLIRNNPNGQATAQLAAWAFGEPALQPSSLKAWLTIFYEREQRFALAPNMHYPLLEQMMEAIKTLGGEPYLRQQPWDLDLINYAISKLNPVASTVKHLPSPVKKPVKAASQVSPQLISQPFNTLSLFKKNSLLAYKNFETCTERQLFIIFSEILSIASPGVENYTTFEGCLHYLDSQGDLSKPLCMQFVQDGFKCMKKEASVDLAKWLIKQPTYHYLLALASTQALVDKHGRNEPMDPYAIEILVKNYLERDYLLDQSFVDAMEILIANDPNHDRIKALAERMMAKEAFQIDHFIQWLSVFKLREERHGSPIVFPLASRLIELFYEKGWQPESLPASIATYLRSNTISRN